MRGSLVENISFEGSIFSSSSSNNLGGLIGNTFTPQNEVRNIVGNVTIEYDQVSNSGSVGGLLGNGNTVLISNISIISNIRGTINNGGGVVGDLGSSSTLEYVIAQVFLNGTRTTFNNRVGGIIGLIQQGAVVRNVVVNGSVRGTDSYRVGGIIGEIINGRIQNSYSNVTLISNGVVGGAVGLVGSSLTGNYLENVYSKGLVTNLSGVGGGLIGTNGASLAGIVNSFWDIETSNQIISVGGEGRTTEEMNNLSTFAQFGDFETIWAINFEDNSQYPFLRFQGFVPTNQFANDGVGTIENPYQIENCNQLQQMRFLLNSHYILINDIDCSDTINWNSGEGFIPVGDPSTHFMGSLNGQDFTINNLFINRTSDYSGLFGNVDSANIENLMMNNASVIGEDRTGTLVGLAASSTFENITVSNSLSWAFESF